jgi:hypothetical protein
VYVPFVCMLALLVQVFLSFSTYAHVPCMPLLFCATTFRCLSHASYAHVSFILAFLAQVFFAVNAHASNACISFTLDFLHKSSIHILLMHVFHLHLLFYTSIFHRQYTCF